MATLEHAIAVLGRLSSAGFPSFLVGGCVRDRVLGLTPKDLDIVTPATPSQLLTLFEGARLVGAKFGVIVVDEIEIATFRSEGEYSDGRRPDSVAFVTDPSVDARRRDFTINALMEDPISGQILDFVGGRNDLRHQTIRAIGNPFQRFREDHLRMLRAVRFAARLGFEIETRTAEAIRQTAPQTKSVAAERVRDELTRMLTQANPRHALELLDDLHLLEHVLPEVKAFQGVDQPPQFHPEGDVWRHVLLMIEGLHNPSSTLAWGVLLHDVGKPSTLRIAERIRFDGHAEVGAGMARNIMARLRASNDDIAQVESLVANHMRFKDVTKMRPSTFKRFLRLPRFAEHLELHRLDCLASNGRTDSFEFVRDRMDRMSDDDLRPASLITGRDLIAAGYPPGPEFGEILEAVENAQLDGSIDTREQALELVRNFVSN